MRDVGLTHGGFYKHFASKDELLIESLRESFREIIDTLVRAAEQSPPGEAWKAIVKTYLRPEMCEYPEHGCPLATLGPELARVDRRMKPQIMAELVNYKSRMVPFMPGRRTGDKERAFFAIFSTMIGAVEIARLLPDPAIREKVLASARDFLLGNF
jgi:TetR/AcrR family transcriptional repressor of nem operon